MMADSKRTFSFSSVAIALGHSVDFIQDDDIILHLKVNSGKGVLVVNDYRDGKWGKASELALDPRDSATLVEVELLSLPNEARVALVGDEAVAFQRCGDLRRFGPPRLPDTIECVIERTGPEPESPPALPAPEGAPADSQRVDLHEPLPADPGEWRSFVFSQVAIRRGHSVDYVERGNTLLHLKFLASESQLVINDRHNGVWGTELRLPVPGLVEVDSVEIQVRNGPDCVEISAFGNEKTIFPRCGRLGSLEAFQFSSAIFAVGEDHTDLPPAAYPAPPPIVPGRAAARPEPEAEIVPFKSQHGELLRQAVARWDEYGYSIEDDFGPLEQQLAGMRAEARSGIASPTTHSQVRQKFGRMQELHAALEKAVARAQDRLRERVAERQSLDVRLQDAVVEAARENYLRLGSVRREGLAEERARAARAQVDAARAGREERRRILNGAGARMGWVLKGGAGELPAPTEMSSVPEGVEAVFDAEHYRAYFAEVPEGADLLQHYLGVGWRIGLDPSPFFSVACYQAQGATADEEPLGHFLSDGEAQGCDPHPLIVTEHLRRAGSSLAAFVSEGTAEPHPAFDAAAYASAVNLPPGILPRDALRHYLVAGWREGASPSPLFDRAFYAGQLGEDGTGETEPFLHFILFGAPNGIPPHPLFDVEAYRDATAAIGETWSDPLLHYIEKGEALNLKPNPLFEPAYYRGIADLGDKSQALLHYVTKGAAASLSTHWLFDSKYAMARLLPARPSKQQSPLEFYLTRGLAAFTSPSSLFDIAHYLLERNGISPGEHPVTHFLAAPPSDFTSPHPLFDPVHYGQEHRDKPFLHPNLLADFVIGVPKQFVISPSTLFDCRYYLERNGDVSRLKLNPLVHYLLYGGREGRDPGPHFSTQFYRAKNNISNAVNPLVHYAQSGRELGLPARPADLPATAVATAPGPAAQMTFHPGRRPRVEGAKTVLVVAHIVGRFLFGGERSFLDMLEGFAAMNMNVVAALPQNVPTYVKAVAERATEVVVLRYDWWRNTPVSEPTVAIFEKLIEARGIDCVHANTIMLREPLIAANNRGIPSVVHVRELIEKDEALAKVIGKSPAEIVQTVRYNAQWIVANSRATAQSFHAENRTFIVPNTMDMAVMDIANTVDPAEVRFGIVSSNLSKKGILDLVELADAAKDVAPNARFVLIGPETPLTAELQEAQKAGKISPHIIFAGYAETPRDAVEQLNVVVNFSHFAESFGRTVLEAMAARRPVIAYDWGALPELVTHGTTGFLVPFRKPLDALPAVVKLCGDPSLIASFGEAARETAVRGYSAGHYALRLAQAYRAILGHHPAGMPGATVPHTEPNEALASNRAAARPEVVKRARAPWVAKPGPVKPRIAYFCWHFPVPSETFVLNELRHLVSSGHDVIVFCRQTPHPDFKPDFPIAWHRVSTPEELADQLVRTRRTVAHGHFVYPTVTNFLWPACERANVPFTFIAHAQDIFRHDNDEKNRIGEIGRAPLCRRVLVLSEFHRRYVVERGVPEEKVIINPNAIDTAHFEQASIPERSARKFRAVCAVHRFAEKKGLEHLIRAAALLREDDVRVDLYGYGELEDRYREIIAELGLTNVRICGSVSNREGLLEILQRYDLFACPSVRVESGDMDGIPTSVAEAMAAGLPVLTTGLSGLPNLVTDGITGIVVEPTPESVANGIRRYYALPEAQVDAMIEAARQRVRDQHDVTRICRVLMRVWTDQTVDLILVTWKNLPEHREVLRRLYKYTSLPFHLIVCANSDDPEVVELLESYHAQHDNMTLIHKGYNSFVGPGTNAAMDVGRSDIGIYVCGKEGFTLRHGWEIPFVHHFAENLDVGQAGTLSHSPTYLTGEKYPSGVREFDGFRNKEFAAQNPSRPFFHVQGGFFGIRRTTYEQIGGFSEAVPHDYTDVEFSYYVESCGWRLGEVPGLMALFNKSRPPLLARVDETIGAAHPPQLNELAMFDAIASHRSFNCNLCGWVGESFDRVGHEATCPSCHSTRADRSLMRWLAPSVLLHRRLPALAVGLEGEMASKWAEQFQGPRLSWADFRRS